MSIWNGFWGPSFGGEADAMSFHLAATYHAGSLTQLGEFLQWDGPNIFRGDHVLGHYYPRMLGILYYLTSDTLFIGSIFSTIVWSISACILVATMQLLGSCRKKINIAVFIYTFLPSSILFTSITLREPYQLFFVNLAIYAALKIYFNKSYFYWAVLIVSFICMGSTHDVFLILALFIMMALLFMLYIRPSGKIPVLRIMVVVPVFLLGVYFVLPMVISEGYNISAGLDVAIENYLNGGLATEARSNYKTTINIDGISGLLVFIPVSLFQYLFEPMPWKMSSITDMGAFLENILRAVLLWLAIKGLFNMPSQYRTPLVFVFVSYLVLETAWSLGTFNWGTALRHHIPGVGLMVISAFAYPEKIKITGHQVASQSIEGQS